MTARIRQKISGNGGSQETPREFRVLLLPLPAKEQETLLAEASEQGWELLAVECSRAYLQRPKRKGII